MEDNCMYINKTNVISGYDIPVFGYYCFNAIHVTAIVCLMLSFTAAILTVFALFKAKRKLAFMKWHKHERFLIYRCICDVTYGFVHTLDHTQILVAHDHVHPEELCEFYALILLSVCMSAGSLSLVSALNAFVSIYFGKNINFGQYDWKLLTVLFVGPFVISFIVCMLDVLGPSGFFCAFDSVKGVLANIILSTGFSCLLLVGVAVLYILTWRKIYMVASVLQNQLIDSRVAKSARVKSAKAMCLFVAVYIVQWSSLCVYGTWQIVTEVPFGLFMSVVVMTNLGGVLSGFIYIANSSARNTVSDGSDDKNTRLSTITERPNILQSGKSCSTC